MPTIPSPESFPGRPYTEWTSETTETLRKEARQDVDSTRVPSMLEQSPQDFVDLELDSLPRPVNDRHIATPLNSRAAEPVSIIAREQEDVENCFNYDALREALQTLSNFTDESSAEGWMSLEYQITENRHKVPENPIRLVARNFVKTLTVPLKHIRKMQCLECAEYLNDELKSHDGLSVLRSDDTIEAMMVAFYKLLMKLLDPSLEDPATDYEEPRLFNDSDGDNTELV